VSGGLAVLTKGPVVLGVGASTVAVLALMAWIDRRFAQQQPTAEDYELIVRQSAGQPLPTAYGVLEPKPWGRWILKLTVIILIATAIVLPWVIALQRRMPGSLWQTIRYEVFERMAKPMEQHKGPPGYYLLFFFASFFPWSLMLPTAIKLAWMHRRVPLVRFSLAAVVGPWLLFECLATKLPHYVLPCFPFLAFLTADALFRCMRRRHEDWHTRAWMVGVGVWAGILAMLGLVTWAAVGRFTGLPYAAMAVISLAAAVCAAVVFLRFRQRRIGAAAYAMAGAMIILMGLLFAWYLPAARFLHVSEDVGAYLQSIGATTKGDVLMLTHKQPDEGPLDYKEDSLAFYQGGTIRIQPQTGYLEKTPPEQWPRYMVMTRKIWEKTPESLRERLEILKESRGLAYASRGRVVDVLVVRTKR
jgi:4-amino-4-deoxy-L-arabinose transferase-like glycosyltransferase